MKCKDLKVNSRFIQKRSSCYNVPLGEQRRIVAYLDGLQAKVNALRELQVKGGEG
jgi:hypothetical protein